MAWADDILEMVPRGLPDPFDLVNAWHAVGTEKMSVVRQHLAWLEGQGIIVRAPSINGWRLHPDALLALVDFWLRN